MRLIGHVLDQRDAAWDDGYAAGREAGADGRGSRARYRRAVVAAMAGFDGEALQLRRLLANPLGYSEASLAYGERQVERLERARARCLRILARLDGAG